MKPLLRLAELVMLSALVCVGCGHDSALPLQAEPFRGAEAGYSVRYPEGWTSMFIEHYAGTLFYERNEDIDEIVTWRLAGESPIVLVLAGPAGSVPNVDHDTINDAESMLLAYLEWMRYAEDSWIGRFREIEVDGHPGLTADIRWSQDEVKIKGQAVAVYGEERCFFLEAAGEAEDWRAFLPTLQAILDSVRLN